MKIKQKISSQGFSAIVGALVVFAVIVTVTTIMFVSRNTIKDIVSKINGTSSSNVVPTGTTANIQVLTEQDMKIEAGEDASADDQIRQDINSSNDLVESLGGSYDATDL